MSGFAAQGGTVGTLSPLDAAGEERPSTGKTTRTYIRGSGLLLGGRLISILLNLGVQVLTVRYLSKSEYGAFAYGIGVASIGSSFVLLGLGKTVPRFLPIYREQGDYARVFGTIALAAGTIIGLGLSLVLLLLGLRGVVLGTLISDPLSLSLLLILIALAPINAFDHLLEQLVALFGSLRAVFFRRYIVGPGLKLAAIALVVLVSGNVYLLAYGYVAGGLLGLGIYFHTLFREWRRHGLLQHLHPRRLQVSTREIFGFSIPMLSNEFAVLLRSSIAVLLLEYFQSTTAVAEYQAVYPIAGLNLIVFQAFLLLFVPLASRMFAQSDRHSINDLYWQTSTWITVLTFPILAVTCLLATPVTVLLFGAQYANAGVVLALLAPGYYLNAAFGFNAETLRVFGKVRLSVLSDVLAVVTFLVLGFLLIPRYGAIGAAIVTTATLVVHNLSNHVGLWLGGTSIRLVDWRFIRVYVIVALIMLGLFLSQWLIGPPIPVTIALIAVASLAVVRLTRHLINPEEAFPEILRIPLMRLLVR